VKVYLVEADFDQYEDSYQVSLGLFKHKSKAEIVKLNYEQDIKKLCDEVLVKPIANGEDEDSPEWDEYWSPEWNEYWSNEESKRIANDFNFCTITEYELNEEEK